MTANLIHGILYKYTDGEDDAERSWGAYFQCQAREMQSHLLNGSNCPARGAWLYPEGLSAGPSSRHFVTNE